MIRKLLIGLALACAGCAGMKYTVNCKEHTVGEDEAKSQPAAQPKAPAASNADTSTLAAASTPANAPSMSFSIPDSLKAPAVLQGTTTVNPSQRGTPPTFVLHVPRDGYVNLHVKVFGLPGADLEYARLSNWTKKPGRGAETRYVNARGDYVVWVEAPPGASGPWTVVAYDDTTELDPLAVYGEPAPNAPAKDRDLRNYGPYFERHGVPGPSINSARLAHSLFTSLPRSFFVYPAQPLHSTMNGEFGPSPTPGEPLIYALGFVFTSDGVFYHCNTEDLTATPPASIAMPALRKVRITPGNQANDVWANEDALSIAPEDAEVQRYLKQKADVRACYDREWDKRDPDHTASHYDIATYKGGSVSKVEGLADKIDREVSAKCKLAPLWKQRDKLEAKMLARFETQRESWKGEMAQHVAGR